MWPDSPKGNEQPLLQEFYLTEAERDEAEARQAQTKSKRRSTLCSFQTVWVATVVAAMLASAVAERVSFKVLIDRVENYRFFVMELVVAAQMLFMFVAMVWTRIRTDVITPTMLSVSKWYFVCIALFESLTAILIFVPGGRVPATLTVLLLEASVPVNLVASLLFRSYRKEFKWTHYLGGVTALLALVAALAPVLFSGQLGYNFDGNTLASCFLYAGAAVTGTISMALKEVILRQQEMHTYYMNFWVLFFQLIFGLVFAPLALPLQQPMSSAAWRSTGWAKMAVNWHRGGACIFAAQPAFDNDVCWMSLEIVILFCISTLAFNLTAVELMRLVRLRTCQWWIVASIPLSFVALDAYSNLSSVAQQFGVWPALSPFALGGCVALTAGLFVYNFYDEPGCVEDTPFPDNFAAAHHATDKGAMSPMPAPEPPTKGSGAILV